MTRTVLSRLFGQPIQVQVQKLLLHLSKTTVKKEKSMSKTKVGEEAVPQAEAVVSLAFRIKPHGDNLFSAEILLLHNDTVVERRNGIATTLGHAIGPQMTSWMDGRSMRLSKRRKIIFTTFIYRSGREQ